MNNFSTLAVAVAMIAGFVLLAGGARLAFVGQSQSRGILMIAAGLVLVMNAMIWTV